VGDTQSALTELIFRVVIISFVSDSTLNHRKAPTIPSLKMMDLISWPYCAGCVELCGSVHLDCRKRGGHGRMCGCSTCQPVEAWPNVVKHSIFEVVTNEDTFHFFPLPVSFFQHLFSVTVSSTRLFTEFLRLSTKVEEVSD
jgi:hypothetical protein